MKLHVVREGGTARISLVGCEAIDCANAVAIKSEALARVTDATDLVVDLAGVDFIDSAGVGVLVALFKNARLKGGRARFCGLTPGVRNVLEIIRLDQIFEIVDDVAAVRR